MTEEQLIQMVKTIRNSSGCMMDLDGLLERFEANVKDPSAAQLIFEPGSGGRLLEPQEVVAKAGVKSNGDGKA